MPECYLCGSIPLEKVRISILFGKGIRKFSIFESMQDHLV